MDEKKDGQGPESHQPKPHGVFAPKRGEAATSGRGAFARTGSGVKTDRTERVGGGRKQASETPSTKTQEKSRRLVVVRMLLGLWWTILVVLAIGVGTLAGVVLFDRVLMPKVVLLGGEVVVPAVAGLELAEAEARLRTLGLKPTRVAGRHHPAVPGGRVLDVSPPIGMSVKAGRQVHLIPSLGGLNRKVPDVVGLSLRMAEMNLSASGFRVRELREAATKTAPPGQVLAMSPQAGTDAPVTFDVALLVSRLRAATPFAMPDLRGRKGADAAAWLRGRGFRVEQTTSDAPGRPGYVFDQSPQAGDPVWPGSEIRLTLSRSAEDRERRRFRF